MDNSTAADAVRIMQGNFHSTAAAAQVDHDGMMSVASTLGNFSANEGVVHRERHVLTVSDHPVAPLFVGSHLFLHGLKKLGSIWLLHGLMMVHGVRISGRSERNGVGELFL